MDELPSSYLSYYYQFNCVLAVSLPCAWYAGLAVPWHAAAASANPLMESGPFPRWGEIKAEHVLPAVKQVIAEESASLDLLEQDLVQALKDGSLSFDRLFLPLTQMRLRMDGVYSQFEHLSVSRQLHVSKTILPPAVGKQCWCSRQCPLVNFDGVCFFVQRAGAILGSSYCHSTVFTVNQQLAYCIPNMY
jgi:hypothetical protein